jgi:2-Cys peroxiredoxin 5
LAAQDKFKAKGIDEILIFCINDAAVMDAWADSQKVGRDGEGSMVNFIADTSGALTDALSMRMNHDGPRGVFAQDRCKRFSALVVDGVVKALNVAEAPDDPAGDTNPAVSLAAQMLKDLDNKAHFDL